MTKRSSTKPQPEPDWTFFTDRDLGNIVPNALRNAGYRVERHDDHFQPDTEDREWLPIVAQKGWVALSHNKKMRSVSYERDAAMRSGLRLFFLIGKMPHPDHATNLIATMPKVLRFLNNNNPPFIAHIHRPETKHPIGARGGSVDMVLTKAEWESQMKIS